MTTAFVGPLENRDGAIKCMHRRCDGRRATWAVYRYQKPTLHSCSVHLPFFASLAAHERPPAGIATTATIGISPLRDFQHTPCPHENCDGHHYAKWSLRNATGERHESCSVHLARFVERLLRISSRSRRIPHAA